MKRNRFGLVLLALVVWLWPSALFAVDNSGSTGADGALEVVLESGATALYVNGQNVGASRRRSPCRLTGLQLHLSTSSPARP